MKERENLGPYPFPSIPDGPVPDNLEPHQVYPGFLDMPLQETDIDEKGA